MPEPVRAWQGDAPGERVLRWHAPGVDPALGGLARALAQVPPGYRWHSMTIARARVVGGGRKCAITLVLARTDARQPELSLPDAERWLGRVLGLRGT
jgi:hypothetical protein